MPGYNTAMQKATLDDAAPEVHGRISKRIAELDGVSVTEVTFDVGATWSIDLKGYAGTELCELPHVALVTAGTLRVVMTDGAEQDFSAGQVMLLPPGHDAWTIGEQPCTFIEFSRGNDYYSLEIARIGHGRLAGLASQRWVVQAVRMRRRMMMTALARAM